MDRTLDTLPAEVDWEKEYRNALRMLTAVVALQGGEVRVPGWDLYDVDLRAKTLEMQRVIATDEFVLLVRESSRS